MPGQSVSSRLEDEFNQLRWRKLANESELKAAILKEKQIKKKGRADAGQKKCSDQNQATVPS